MAVWTIAICAASKICRALLIFSGSCCTRLHFKTASAAKVMQKNHICLSKRSKVCQCLQHAMFLSFHFQIELRLVTLHTHVQGTCHRSEERCPLFRRNNREILLQTLHTRRNSSSRKRAQKNPAQRFLFFLTK
jgi:hypothetical protein